MAQWRIAVFAAVLVAVIAGVWLLADSPVATQRVAIAAERPVIQLPPPRPFSQLAQPCLIGTASCLDLSPEPFAPCLIAVKPCNREWNTYLLGSPNSKPAQPYQLRPSAR